MRWLCLALLLAAPVAHAQEAGVLDAGMPLEAGTEAGVADAGMPMEAGALDAGLPLGEHEDEETESELPEDRRPEIEYRIEPADGIMTGDLVHAILVVRLRGENDDVTIGRQDFGDLELHDQRHTDRREDGRRIFTFELDFLALEPGEHEIEPITLRVVTEDGVIGTIRTEARTVTVGSLTANEPDAQPRPATAPIPVMEDDYTLAYVLGFLGAMLLAALLGFLFARWYRARPKAEPPPPPPRPPGEVALEKLRTLRRKTRTAVEEGKAAEIVDGASDVLREYLGARYGFNGLESTTDEVVARLKNERLGPISHNEIVALLGDADLVKFAKAQPDEPQCDRMIEGAERIVLGTVPSATAVAAPAPPRIDQTPVRKKKERASLPSAVPVVPDPLAKAVASDAKVEPAAESVAASAAAPEAAPDTASAAAPEAASASAPASAAEAASASAAEVAPAPAPVSTTTLAAASAFSATQPGLAPSSAPKATAAASAFAAAPIPAPARVPAPDAAKTLEDGAEVDHLGRRIPDTNPPPPPDPNKTLPVTSPGAPPVPRPSTLLGNIDPSAPASTTLPDAPPATPPDTEDRKTPVGFRDPKDGGDA